MVPRPDTTRGGGSDAGLPEEVRAALDDLRQIRAVIDESHDTHPLRQVMRPLMLFAALQAPITIVVGVMAQWMLERNELLFGLSPVTMIWIICVVAGVVVSVVKGLVIAFSSRRVGYDMTYVYRAIFSGSWARLVLPGFTLMGVASIALALSGASWMIFGVVTVGVGAIWVSYATIFPLREMTGIGVILIILGIVATFAFPEWTFYKLAAIWGLSFGLAGLVLYKKFPPLPPREETDSAGRS